MNNSNSLQAEHWLSQPGVWSSLLALLLFVLSLQTVQAKDSPASEGPVRVEVGLRLHQIVEINQKKKNFTAVITLKAKWNDPRLAYDPAEQKTAKTLNRKAFTALLTEKGTDYPASVFFNQQGKHHSHNSLTIVQPNGEVTFQERVTIVLQASNFNFKRFPFDTQLFEIHLDSLFPEERFVFKEMKGFSGMDQELGEEEWVVTNITVGVTNSDDTHDLVGSRFTLAFKAKRHVMYYILKIFIPLTLIIMVSWFTFFLKDYSKRIDLAGANLLLFIAFNFTISNELPKLGYITFLDALLVSTFIITSIVVLINVLLKRMLNKGHGEVAEAIDRYALWAYPLVYLVGASLVVLFTLLLA